MNEKTNAMGFTAYKFSMDKESLGVYTYNVSSFDIPSHQGAATTEVSRRLWHQVWHPTQLDYSDTMPFILPCSKLSVWSSDKPYFYSVFVLIGTGFDSRSSDFQADALVCWIVSIAIHVDVVAKWLACWSGTIPQKPLTNTTLFSPTVTQAVVELVKRFSTA